MKKDTWSDLYILAWQRVKELTNKELLCFVSSKSREVRGLIIQEFHCRPVREVFDIAIHLIYQKNAISREAGYLILGQLGATSEPFTSRPFKEESVPYLISGLNFEKATSVKSAIACAIGHLKPLPCSIHNEIIAGLTRYSDEHNESVRISVAFAVSGFSASSPSLKKLLNKLLDDDSHKVREWVKLSIETINTCDNLNP